jgi:hypothetical protein
VGAWPVSWSGWPDLNRRPLRPEHRHRGNRLPVRRRARRSRRFVRLRSPHLTAREYVRPLPLCSQNRTLARRPARDGEQREPAGWLPAWLPKGRQPIRRGVGAAAPGSPDVEDLDLDADQLHVTCTALLVAPRGAHRRNGLRPVRAGSRRAVTFPERSRRNVRRMTERGSPARAARTQVAALRIWRASPAALTGGRGAG